MIERRKYKRPSMIGLVDLIEQPGQPPTEAYSINISYGGMAIYSRKALTDRVWIKVYFEDATGKRLSEMVTGRVAWTRPLGTWQAAGIEFDNLDPKLHSMILGFLERSEE